MGDVGDRSRSKAQENQGSNREVLWGHSARSIGVEHSAASARQTLGVANHTRRAISMTIPNLSWYLCILFAVALAFSSAITVAPGGQAWMRWEMGIWVALSILFAAVAIIFRWFRAPQPGWLLWLF